MNRVTELLNAYFENVPEDASKKEAARLGFFIIATVFFHFGMGRQRRFSKL